VPTVHRLGSLRVVIYLNDHRPAHVHVVGDGRSAIFDLHCPAGPPVLRQNFGFPRGTITLAARHVELHVGDLCEAWRNIHGDF
jgi:hypothetical protein